MKNKHFFLISLFAVVVSIAFIPQAVSFVAIFALMFAVLAHDDVNEAKRRPMIEKLVNQIADGKPLEQLTPEELEEIDSLEDLTTKELIEATERVNG